MHNNLSFYSHGKLLLTGEYAVLDGALSLALPCQKGQWLKVFPSEKEGVFWKSKDLNGQIWFEKEIFKTSATNDPIAHTLEKILTTALYLNPDFAKKLQNCTVETELEFERNWGLGTSSTLINNIAQWAEVNAFDLLFKGFGGSGYDIACAKSTTPILYQTQNQKPKTYPICFSPNFKKYLFFVHLNQKQDSKVGIAHYKSIKKGKKTFIEKITQITEDVVRSKSFTEFCSCIDLHEQITSDFIGLEPVKSKLFSDFQGSIKSLGAWGGDFVLVACEQPDVKTYFENKGFHTVIAYQEMVL